MKRYLPATLRKSLALAAALMLVAGPGGGDVPKVITYQGRLIQNGVPANGNFNMYFRICDNSACSAGFYREPSAGDMIVTVSTGLFSVQLGNSNPIPDSVFDGPNAYIEVNVAAETLLPRERITAHPYALRASSASVLAAQENALGVYATTSVFVVNGSSMGIGTSLLSGRLNVGGQIIQQGTAGTIQLQQVTPGHAEAHLRPSAGNNGWVSYSEAAVADRWLVGIRPSDARLYFATGNTTTNTNRMVLDGSGQLGIGTTNPTSPLYVLGQAEVDKLLITSGGSQSSPALANGPDNNTGVYWTGTDGIGIATSGSARIFADSGGKVGIGTTVPGSLLHVNGAAQVGVGSSGSPSLHFGDTDSGLFSPGSKQVGIATSGNTRVFVKEDGAVGIGTTSPNAQLDVVGTARVGVGTSATPSLQVRDANSGLFSPGIGQLGIATSGSTRVFVDSDGEVGIGTTVPGSLLHVNGRAQVGVGSSGSPSLHFGDTDSGLFSPGTRQVGIATSGSTRVFVDSDGEVGIGTTAPTARLDAAGTFKLGSNGAVITGLRKSSISWPVPSTGAGACSDFASAMTAGSVVIGVVTTAAPAAGSFFGPGGCGSPSARDWSNPSFGNGGQEVWLHYRNNTGGALDPDGAGTTGFDIYYLEP